MKYLVMECHSSYVVVMDEKGRFIKAANLSYEEGQKIEEILPMRESRPGIGLQRNFLAAVAAAACICFLLLGSWQLFLVPVGTVQLQINPDVRLSVNRLDYVIAQEALNEDGKTLLEGLSVLWKKTGRAVEELADRAVVLEYLAEGGQITLTATSSSDNWKKKIEAALSEELSQHFEYKVRVEVKEEKGNTKDLEAGGEKDIPAGGEDAPGDKNGIKEENGREEREKKEDEDRDEKEKAGEWEEEEKEENRREEEEDKEEEEEEKGKKDKKEQDVREEKEDEADQEAEEKEKGDEEEKKEQETNEENDGEEEQDTDKEDTDDKEEEDDDGESDGED